MNAIIHERCFNHALREAAARCPQCRKYFCRECVTEHDDRVLCTACLRQFTGVKRGKGRSMARLLKIVWCVAGFLTAWFFFFLIGSIFRSLPSQFHKAVLWNAPETREE